VEKHPVQLNLVECVVVNEFFFNLYRLSGVILSLTYFVASFCQSELVFSMSLLMALNAALTLDVHMEGEPHAAVIPNVPTVGEPGKRPRIGLIILYPVVSSNKTSFIVTFICLIYDTEQMHIPCPWEEVLERSSVSK